MENNPKRLLYFDNLRLALIILVVLAHIAITYGPIGFWYYYERTGFPSTYILAFFISLMQGFLIGLFFLISGFFIPMALDNKGPKRFLLDRAKRLGIPLVFYIFIMTPSIMYLDNFIIKGEKVNYFIFYFQHVLKKGIIDVGPLWFLYVLLLFSISYAIFNEIIKRVTENKKQLFIRFPSNISIFIVIFILASLTFLLRLRFPISATTKHLNFGLAPQYIFLFALGIIAFKNGWFEKITREKAKYWTYISMAAIISWPFFIIPGSINATNMQINSGLNMEVFSGGLSWQAFIYSFWESILSISLSICVIYVFKKKFGKQTKFLQKLSRSAYTVFIIHAVIIVLLAYSLKDFPFHPLIKFLIVSLVGIPICFLISFYIKKIHFLRNIL